jgi:hypothetical protein
MQDDKIPCPECGEVGRLLGLEWGSSISTQVVPRLKTLLAETETGCDTLPEAIRELKDELNSLNFQFKMVKDSSIKALEIMAEHCTKKADYFYFAGCMFLKVSGVILVREGDPCWDGSRWTREDIMRAVEVINGE